MVLDTSAVICRLLAKRVRRILRQAEEGLAPLAGDLGRRTIGYEEFLRAEIVERDQPGDAARQLRMSGQGTVLCARQQQSRVDLEQGDGRKDSDRRGDENQKGRIHADER